MDGFKEASVSIEKQTNKGNYPRLELPPEMLEMIFAHSGNLLELTLVCPTFNDIISKSPLLMSKLKVKWTAPFIQTLCLLRSDRKYERLYLCRRDRYGWQQLKNFIEKHKRTLTDLEIERDFKNEPRQYFECLSILSENLKMLKASGLPEEMASMSVLEFPKLEELTWCSSRFQLQTWKTPKLKKFSQTRSFGLWPPSQEIINKNVMMSFLREQPQLQELEFSEDLYVEAFFEAASISPFSFSLTSFKIVASFCFINIFPFLETQRQSLKVLSLKSDLSDLQAADLRNILTLELEELELSTYEYPSIGPSIVHNKTIKKLTLIRQALRGPNIDRSVSLIGSCPNVETLSLKFFEISKALSSAIASKLTKLKNLNLTGCSFHFPLFQMDRYPSVETFSVKYGNRQEWETFVTANPQLRVIKICSAT